MYKEVYLMGMVRTQIYLTRRQHRLIQKLAKQEDISASEIIRQALDRYLEKLSPEREQDPLFQIVGLGASGDTKGSIEHDRVIYGE